MGNDVIATVEAMDLSEGQPTLDRDSSLFKWKPGVFLNDKELTVAQDPTLYGNIHDYGMELPREVEIRVNEEDLGYNNTSTETEESIFDDVNDVNSVEELEEASVNSDAPDPNVDPTPAPRMPELVDESESSANDDTDGGSPLYQNNEGTCRYRTTQYHMDL